MCPKKMLNTPLITPSHAEHIHDLTDITHYPTASYGRNLHTLTDTITQTIDERVQSKTLKPNSVGLPQAIRDLIKEKR